MQIKRFEGESISQALKAVKAEFGADAVILETRKLGGRRKGVQVTAAFDAKAGPGTAGVAKGALATLPEERPDGPVDPPWARGLAPRSASGAPPPKGPGVSLAEVHAALSPLRDEIAAVAAGLSAALTGRAAPAPPDLAGLREELSHLRAQVGDLGLDRRARALSGGPRAAYRTLVDRGLPRRLAVELAGALPDGDPGRLAEAVAARIPVTGPLVRGGVPSRVLLAGPTGVGKTTTIAKLAAHFAVTEKRRVALVTLDTYRIGAVEQLSTYARIIGVSCDVASGPAELRDRLKALAGAELVLIDTAGRSPRDPDHVQGLVAAVPPEVDVHLVLPATGAPADHGAVVTAYAPLRPKGLVLTKLDEAQRLGAAVHAAVTSGIPVSYLTDGQRVPEDLQLASGARVATRFLGPDPAPQRRAGAEDRS